MPWLALTLEVDADAADALSDALLEEGARSVWQESTEKQNCRLVLLLDIQAVPGDVLSAAAARAGLEKMPRFSTARVEDEDWVRRSQAQFRPITIGKRLWIGPTWSTPPQAMAAVVRLDPGLAFGTGSHASTKLVLDFLEKNIRRRALARLRLRLRYIGDRRRQARRGARACGGHRPRRGLRRGANAAANGVPMRTAVPEELAPLNTISSCPTSSPSP